MQNLNDAVYARSGADMVGAFLKAIKDGDTLTFWRLLDNRGQGYFMGMWFYALGNADLTGVALLAEDENFLRDALGGIVGDLRTNLEALLDNPQIGELQNIDSHHARVPVTTAGHAAPDEPLTEYIPLVLELAPAGAASAVETDGSVGMTCWKIDTLKCFRMQKT
ncbi:hypothetical protein [Desulfoscipio geothermicus]|uniref:Uncharacterized protein n=1 Tax=Desulfoscipio geothermicus DSM 3669 TaxID=1121426 RepID=A0A1I6CP23_9FIRM|nr:hypothetical protein [Desulfoscipio geothermicus]SFQ94931.1 hypothetical protein SAMN05660706_10186 [Desulfoscipio geothermicus DSM 3669]